MTILVGKEGPIYSVQWSPKNQDFCVVYGFMPSKATLFNLKCEPIFEFGTGARNSIYYNPHGNILLLGGFGNLRGHVDVWDANSKKKIGEFICLKQSSNTIISINCFRRVWSTWYHLLRVVCRWRAFFNSHYSSSIKNRQWI